MDKDYEVAIVVSGWRESLSPRQKDVVKQVFLTTLEDVLALGPVVVYEGGAHGVDSYIRKLAEDASIHVRTFKAQWGTLGNAAGPIRNGEMLRHAQTHCLVTTMIAFPHPTESVGTWDCARQAIELGIDVALFPLPK